ncbi:acyl transferase/acyl hydrolase/lysophospholipase [Fusarium oxysporum Fo47]|uniref:acyl transferase/acyl hydrolase/lysophospholipase n=1 Tax=Fusarium oxysporum Fo47 TaxID=660027 RepID=UPI0028698835|nr:acyl transferase/acyl hydrolase/lysophospholipase [Fusarium oxysporum Fo47]QKD57463.2 acyl transferase/acyl hydrolase/lysophospholipase [Fusarium oxysporum Fo47]
MAIQDHHFWVLSLDGGGVRALSSLIILNRLMREAGKEPAAVFTAAVGTSGGGYVWLGDNNPRALVLLNALMIGRLGLELTACQQQFLILSREVFQHREPWYMLRGILRPRYSHLRMEEEIKRVIEVAMLDRNVLMQAAAAAHTSMAHTGINCEVWKASRATSAAPTCFPPQDIGTASYVDGGLGFNNPIQTISDEYKHLGFQDVDEKRITYVSIGTGKPSNNELDRARQFWRQRPKSFRWSALQRFLAFLPPHTREAQLAGYLKAQKAWNVLLDLAEEENAHLSFQIAVGQDPPGTKRYFRFNCDKEFDVLDDGRGLCDIALDGYEDLQNIEDVTNMYLRREPAEIDQCVEQLRVHARTIAFVA